MQKTHTTRAPLRAVLPGAGLRVGLAVAGAVLVNGALQVAAVRLLDVSLPAFEPLVLATVVTSSVVGALLGGVAYLACLRLARDPDRTFRRLVVAGTALSMIPPVGLLYGVGGSYADTTVATVGVLALMHVTVALVCLAVLPTRPWAGRR